MAQCSVCKKYGDTGKVGLGIKSTGAYREVEMCSNCTVKGAIAVDAMGGEVRVVQRSSSNQSSSMGAWWTALALLVTIGLVISWLAS